MVHKELHGYNTKQKSLVTSFFMDNFSNHYTADQVCDAIKSSGVSRSTVYRTIERLVEDGVILKYNFGKGKSACYQYCSENHDDATYHFVCTKCKCVQHLHCDILDELQTHLNCDHSLKIDRSLTVLYGTCRGCISK